MFRVHRCRRPHVGHRKARASRALRATNDMRAPAQAGWCAVLPRNRRGGVQTAGALRAHQAETWTRSEEHTSELQSLMRISYAVFCLKKKTRNAQPYNNTEYNKSYNTT